MRKRRLWVSILVGLGAAMVLAGLFRQPLYSAVEAGVVRLFPGQQAGPNDLYTYTVEIKPDGHVYVLVQVDFRDSAARERYMRANRANAEALVRKGGAPVYVSVSFAKPVPIQDFEALVKETGFEVEQYILEAQDQQGSPSWTGSRPDYQTTGKLVDMERLRPRLEKFQRSLTGGVLLVGKVPASQQGLGRLLSDNRVYIADVVAAEVVDKVSKETGASASTIHVGVLSPYNSLRPTGQ